MVPTVLNATVLEWVLEPPYAILDGAMIDLMKASETCFTKGECFTSSLPYSCLFHAEIQKRKYCISILTDNTLLLPRS